MTKIFAILIVISCFFIRIESAHSSLKLSQRHSFILSGERNWELFPTGIEEVFIYIDKAEPNPNVYLNNLVSFSFFSPTEWDRYERLGIWKGPSIYSVNEFSIYAFSEMIQEDLESLLALPFANIAARAREEEEKIRRYKILLKRYFSIPEEKARETVKGFIKEQEQNHHNCPNPFKAILFNELLCLKCWQENGQHEASSVPFLSLLHKHHLLPDAIVTLLG